MNSPTSLADAQTMYDLYIAAEKAILLGQEYVIGDRRLRRSDLDMVVASRKDWGKLVEKLTVGLGNVPRVMRVIPR